MLTPSPSNAWIAPQLSNGHHCLDVGDPGRYPCLRVLMLIILVAGSGMLGCLYPFAAVLRGSRLLRTVGIAWALMVGLIILGFVLPPRGYRAEWPQDKAATIAAVFLVWVFPLLSSLFALLVRKLIRDL